MVSMIFSVLAVVLQKLKSDTPDWPQSPCHPLGLQTLLQVPDWKFIHHWNWPPAPASALQSSAQQTPDENQTLAALTAIIWLPAKVLPRKAEYSRLPLKTHASPHWKRRSNKWSEKAGRSQHHHWYSTPCHLSGRYSRSNKEGPGSQQAHSPNSDWQSSCLQIWSRLGEVRTGVPWAQLYRCCNLWPPTGHPTKPTGAGHQHLPWGTPRNCKNQTAPAIKGMVPRNWQEYGKKNR